MVEIIDEIPKKKKKKNASPRVLRGHVHVPTPATFGETFHSLLHPLGTGERLLSPSPPPDHHEEMVKKRVNWHRARSHFPPSH